MTTNPLSGDQIAFYHDQGYTFLGRVLDDEILAHLRAEEARFRPTPLRDNFDEPDAVTVFRSLTCSYSEAVRRYAISGPHLPLVRQLVGPDVCYWYDQFVTKFPDRDLARSEFPWHQDNGYVPLYPETNVTVWIALDDVDESNGCVWVLAESHKQGLLPHQSKSTESWHLTVPVQGDGVPVVLKAGEAVAFSALTLHRSKQNFTDRPRRGFFLEYCDANAVYGAERRPVVDAPHSWVVLGQIPVPPKP